MKKETFLISTILVIVLLFTGCSYLKMEQKAVDLPIVSIKDTDDEISPAFYEKGFDFKYDVLPQLVLTDSNSELQISFADNFGNSIQLAEDYYTYRGDTGVCKRLSYHLKKDENGRISLPITRRGSDRDEEGIYYLKNKQGTFVFKVILPLKV
ncbi:hypothetical protein RBG61_10530 [Paludicola sp. MB14-C6]|uniref:hypothetical protein n=1 Tax=Paludihabitans sp. MB14-C6 TaxID=3070656 RepID=UPI0027DB7FD6|nr:hypothetical protein [Paludicola sp. MB14-C6]WMJ22420.1 hypothetical protein RBG61_10530 [Paludicola sp. MB14-C6]